MWLISAAVSAPLFADDVPCRKNDEARMSNVERSPKAQMTKARGLFPPSFKNLSFLRHSTFEIRHFRQPLM
jgi:hypothetical protein